MLIVLVALLGVAAVLGACGEGGGSSGVGADDETTTEKKDDLPEVDDSEFVDETGKAEVTITTKDNVFEPRYVKVSPGTKITWDNVGAVPHNVLPADEGAFETIPAEDLEAGVKASLTFEDDGTFPYYCSLHGTARQGMNGRIIVVP